MGTGLLLSMGLQGGNNGALFGQSEACSELPVMGVTDERPG
jgi:hypothetical protein